MAEDTERTERQPQPEAPQKQGDGRAQTVEERLARSILRDGDDDTLDVKHMREVLAALRIDGKWFRRQIPMFLLVFLVTVAYVTNSYQAQQEILKEEELNDSLEDSKYRCLTRESEFTRRTRASQVERELRERGDSTLVPSTDPPFLLTDE